MRDDIIPCGDVTLPSPSSGANKLACAYCQASPAALVDAPLQEAPLSPLVCLISSNIGGDINFQSSRLLFHAFREIDIDRSISMMIRTETKM